MLDELQGRVKDASSRSIPEGFKFHSQVLLQHYVNAEDEVRALETLTAKMKLVHLQR